MSAQENRKHVVSEEQVEFLDAEGEHHNEDAHNELYDLLDASHIDGDTALSAIGFDSFAHSAGSEFQNASMLLGDAALQGDVFSDVYRSVSAVDFASQHQTALGGQLGLDKPFELLSSSSVKREYSEEPAPRIFSCLPLELTHMYVHSSLEELKTLVTYELNTIGCDLMFVNHGCFWRGMFYPEEPCQAVDFRVYVNSCPQIGQKNRYLLEFVRRRGDSMGFHKLFNCVRLAALDGGKLTKDNGDLVRSIDELALPMGLGFSSRSTSAPALSRSTSHSSTPLPLELSAEEEACFNNVSYSPDETLFEPLLSMSKSEYEDVHVQGLALISYEARKEGMSQRMVAACPELVGLLLRRLRESSHPEVRRHCCTALCSMAAVTELHKELVDAGACTVLASVASSNYSKATGETQRQAASALVNMCKNAESKQHVLHAVLDKIDIFKTLSEKCDDDRLKLAIKTVSSSLDAC